eukprot:gb/GEZN01009679.1/.p1 GENE.gb/GEZN01009679.1/~~gb/GEZN01009679.1/.p1  ORF type:complete len:304 (+),score=34.19 gb/GEZN01009679.1/:94-1005(+)
MEEPDVEPQEKVYESLDLSSFVVFSGTKNLRHGMRRAEDNDNPNCLKLCREGFDCSKKQRGCPFTHIAFGEDNRSQNQEWGKKAEENPIPMVLLPEALFDSINDMSSLQRDFQAFTVNDDVLWSPHHAGSAEGTPGGSGKRRRRRKRRNRNTPQSAPRHSTGAENMYHPYHNRPYGTFLTPQPHSYYQRTDTGSMPPFASPFKPQPQGRVRVLPRRLEYSTVPTSPAKGSLAHSLDSLAAQRNRSERALQSLGNVFTELPHYPHLDYLQQQNIAAQDLLNKPVEGGTFLFRHKRNFSAPSVAI